MSSHSSLLIRLSNSSRFCTLLLISLSSHEHAVFRKKECVEFGKWGQFPEKAVTCRNINVDTRNSSECSFIGIISERKIKNVEIFYGHTHTYTYSRAGKHNNVYCFRADCSPPDQSCSSGELYFGIYIALLIRRISDRFFLLSQTSTFTLVSSHNTRPFVTFIV